MGDLENLMALKNMIENKDVDEKNVLMEKEKKFIADVTKACLSEEAENISGIQGYDPVKISKFLERPAGEVQKTLGGEWAEMDEDSFDNFAYVVSKKIQKSMSLINWEDK